MKVGELIEVLQKKDPQMEVGLSDWSEEYRGPLIGWGKSRVRVQTCTVSNPKYIKDKKGNITDYHENERKVKAVVLGAS